MWSSQKPFYLASAALLALDVVGEPLGTVQFDATNSDGTTQRIVAKLVAT